MFTRRKIAALVAEFLGTGILAFIVLTVRGSQIGIPYFIAIAAGLSVMLLGLALNRDVQLNPAYTIALWTARRIKTVKAILFVGVQILGGLAAYSLYRYFAANNGAAPMPAEVAPIPAEFRGTIFVAEAVGAFVFTFLAVNIPYRQAHPVIRSVVAGGAYTLGAIVASAAAVGFINPAVAFPLLALAENGLVLLPYVLAPILGAIIGVNLYNLLYAGNGIELVAETSETSVSSNSSSNLNSSSNSIADKSDYQSPTVANDKPVLSDRNARARGLQANNDNLVASTRTAKTLSPAVVEASHNSSEPKPLERTTKAERNAKVDRKKNKKSRK